VALAHAFMSGPPARGQPAMNARRLDSRLAFCHPGSAANELSMYCARSGAGFGGGQTGHGFSPSWAQPAISTIRRQAKRAMWIVYLEMLVAVAIAAAIVWFTWPRKK
jgi:hypothetical protein